MTTCPARASGERGHHLRYENTRGRGEAEENGFQGEENESLLGLSV